jgi:hypothetical protein
LSRANQDAITRSRRFPWQCREDRRLQVYVDDVKLLQSLRSLQAVCKELATFLAELPRLRGS